MTLTVTIDLSPETEAELRKSIAHRDTERVRQVLAEALTPTVEALLQQPAALLQNDEEWDALADELINRFASAAPADAPLLSDYAVSRAGIYEEHP
jgi:antitoxin ParD1/3/4